jgi:hypothetical protein
VPEPLFVLAEPLLSLVGSDLGLGSSAVALNVTRQADSGNRVASTPYATAFGDLAILQARAQAAGLDPAAVATFGTALDAALGAHFDAGGSTFTGGGWGNFRPRDTPTALLGSTPSDLGLGAQLLLVFLQGLCGVRLQGGYAASGTQYATPGIAASPSAALPTGWDNVAVSGLGPDQASDVVLLNKATVVNPTSSTAGFVAWSGISTALTL